MNPSLLFRRFMRTKLGTLFLLILCIAAGLFLVNFASSAYAKIKSSSTSVSGADYDSHGGRELAGLHGMPNLRRGGHGRLGRLHRSQVCRVPKLTLSADTNKHAFHKMSPLNCSGEQLFYISSGNLRINKTVLGKQKLQRCEYRSIEWVSDHLYTYSKTYIRDREPFDIKVKHDFFRVECFLHKTSSSHQKEAHDTDHYRRRLLAAPSNEAHAEIVLNNAPRQVGSFGIPDMPDVMLNQHAAERNEMAAKKGLEHLLSRRNFANTSKTSVAKQTKLSETDNPVADSEEDDKEIDGEIDDEEDVGILDQREDEYSEYTASEASDFDQFVAQIHVKEEVEERVAEIQPHESSLGINVLIFALDSMSHLSYQRKLPKTYAYLKDVLNAVILDGYNIVGDATTAALIPILTGHSELELPETRLNKENSHFVDIYPFLWNKFEQKGYVTFYAEDQPHIGTFQRRLNGFEKTPVDHYMRPFWQAVLDSELHKDSEQFCLGSKPEHKYTLDYLRQFFMRYQKFPKFSFAFIGELSHADNNPAEYIDADLVRFINYLREQEVLENTLLIVMGDHGARYSSVRGTLQGKLEERLPMMSLMFPQWFQDKYPDLYHNVKRNRMKLTTPYDIHETLRDLIDINRAKFPVHETDRGISLFKAIPANRTCQSAGVDLHWCTCMQMEEVQITDTRVQRAANKIVEHINELLAGVRSQCEQLRLMDIRNASFVFPNEQVLKFQKSIDFDQRVANFSKTYNFDVIHLQVTIETAPNEAVYEGTVQINMKDGSYVTLSDISRINKYSDQSSCVVKRHPDLGKFCYCTK